MKKLLLGLLLLVSLGIFFSENSFNDNDPLDKIYREVLRNAPATYETVG